MRRNALSDFESINRNGKIAMKLDEGDRIVSVSILRPDDDVQLTTAHGQCIRFLAHEEVRLFKGRDSDGVRGIRLEDGDTVISMAILGHVDVSAEERSAYLKQASAIRRAQTGEEGEAAVEVATGDEEAVEGAALTPERFSELGAREQFVLTVSEKGFGKRSSSYEYRTSGRGGKGIVAMVVNDRNGPLVASFPILDSDQIMLVTDAGEKVVSVESISDEGGGEGETGEGEAGEGETGEA